MAEKLEASKANVMLLDSSMKDWHAINWQQVLSRVNQLRQRIYRASVEGDKKKVGNLQRLQSLGGCLSRMLGN
ncbi:MAG: reverse transcriptase N-terminal domain-containing protein [Roseivirga sp.]